MEKSRIIKNAIRCKNCGDIIESKSVHDFVACSCFRNEEDNKGVFVDGGKEYLRRGGCFESIEDLSICEFIMQFKEDVVEDGKTVFTKDKDYTFTRTGNLINVVNDLGVDKKINTDDWEDFMYHYIKVYA